MRWRGVTACVREEGDVAVRAPGRACAALAARVLLARVGWRCSRTL